MSGLRPGEPQPRVPEHLVGDQRRVQRRVAGADRRARCTSLAAARIDLGHRHLLGPERGGVEPLGDLLATSSWMFHSGATTAAAPIRSRVEAKPA